MIVDDWTYYNHALAVADAKDVYTPANPINGMRTRLFTQSGLFRLSRRTSAMYSIEIKTCGSWGRILLFDARDNWLFFLPSTFTGSFNLEPCAFDGLYLLSMCGPGADTVLTLNWREPDTNLV